MCEPTNDDRAEWALEAGKVFAKRTGLSVDADELTCVISDLIADLMHLARKRGYDAEHLLDNGASHFRIEVQEEEEGA